MLINYNKQKARPSWSGFCLMSYILDLKPRGMRTVQWTVRSQAGPETRLSLKASEGKSSWPLLTSICKCKFSWPLPYQAYQPHQAYQPYQAYHGDQAYEPYQAYQPHQNLPIEVDAPCFPQKVPENIELSGVQAIITLHGWSCHNDLFKNASPEGPAICKKCDNRAYCGTRSNPSQVHHRL